jgi:hypothetical protein
MELVNTTPLSAGLQTADLPGESFRIGMVVAKATYTWDPSGQLSLETQEPQDLREGDEESDCGLLPRDSMPVVDGLFEVFLCGKARPQGGEPSTRVEVGLTVGDVTRSLVVTGDRRWVPESEGDLSSAATLSAPQPFTEMPLTWERSFGGTVWVEIDEEAFMMAADPDNPVGRGMDPTDAALALGDQFQSPEGYPRVTQPRLAPNVEKAECLVSDSEGRGVPVAWTAVPMNCAAQSLRSVKVDYPEDVQPVRPEFQDAANLRAHPDWVIDVPRAAAPLMIDGVAAEGPLSLNLPELRVYADYAFGQRAGTTELAPAMLVLEPERRLLTITFKKTFNFPWEEELNRSMRLRTQEGWFTDQGRQA